jgi:hypothetical protein
LSRPEDLRNPLGVREIHLDRRIDCGLIVGLVALPTERQMEVLAREVGDASKRRLVVHENNPASIGSPGSLQDSIRTGLQNLRPNPVDHIAIIPLIENARDVEYAVLEDLDRNLLLAKRAIPGGHQDHRDAIVSEPRCPLRDDWSLPVADLVLFGLAALEDALLFELDEHRRQGQAGH